MNKRKSIGIIGAGFVGKAVYMGFASHNVVKVYDIDPSRSFNTLEETLECDVIFVCLPTPSNDFGECDLSYVYDFFKNVPKNNNLFVLKSTVPIGTTNDIKQKFNLRVVYNPEFLSARTAVQDFLTATRIIIGGDTNDAMDLANVYKERFNNIPCIFFTTSEAECIKTALNSFFAVKVWFFNKLFNMCTEYELEYEHILQGILTDGRVSRSHTDVPGPDGKFGFGGACLPKDLKSFITMLNNKDINVKAFINILSDNQHIRLN